MKSSFNKGVIRPAAMFLVAAFYLCGPLVTTCAAQAFLETLASALPLETIESIIGPIFPKCSIASTFRSEIGIGVAGTQIQGAKLTGSGDGELDLRKVMPMDGGPNWYNLYGNMRIWRFGLRGTFSNFEARSQAMNRGKFDFSGLSVGADVDLIQQEWLTFGVALDHYFFEPRIEASMLTPPISPQWSPFMVSLNGLAPSTYGTYCRYVPPEVLGLPVHLETFHKRPMGGGTKVLNYGGALVFRPQFYRFDLACKIRVEKMHVKFDASPIDFVNYGGTPSPAAGQSWEVDMEWASGGVEVAVYF
jgi:hypothetical protein